MIQVPINDHNRIDLQNLQLVVNNWYYMHMHVHRCKHACVCVHTHILHMLGPVHMHAHIHTQSLPEQQFDTSIYGNSQFIFQFINQSKEQYSSTSCCSLVLSSCDLLSCSSSSWQCSCHCLTSYTIVNCSSSSFTCVICI